MAGGGQEELKVCNAATPPHPCSQHPHMSPVRKLNPSLLALGNRTDQAGVYKSQLTPKAFVVNPTAAGLRFSHGGDAHCMMKEEE